MIRILAVAALAALPAQAQSFDEAVRQNVALAVSICTQHVGDPIVARNALLAAGYSYAGFEGTAGDATHRYSAPAGTADVYVYEGQMAPDCRIATAHLDPQAAAALAAGVLDGVFPGRFGATPNAPCPAYAELGAALPLSLYISDGGNGGLCDEGGGAQISIFYAV